MNYEETIKYLYASMPAFHLVGSTAYKPGFENTMRLMDRLGHPYQSFPCIHVAGTNGKGSTSHLIAASLQAAGYKVGLYTSPHLVDFRERIRILDPIHQTLDTRHQTPDYTPPVAHRLADSSECADAPLRHKTLDTAPYSSTPLPPYTRLSACGFTGVRGHTSPSRDTMIPQESVAEFVTKYKDFLDEVRPSFFETTMALCFDYFAKQKVDIAVIEVGLGGRLDATNIITPRLSVITNIGLDHEEFLGDTLAKIAFEKAGIIKPGVPCVIGESNPETDPVFIEKAKACGIWGEGPETTDCKIWFADQCAYLRRCRERDIIECELKGEYQEHNMQTAYVALRQLGIPTHAIQYGFAHVCIVSGLRGRWEQVYAHNRHFILDTGHNSHGLKYVCEQLKHTINQTPDTTHQTLNPTPLPPYSPTPNYTPADSSECADAPRRHQTPKLHIIFGMVNDKDVEVVMGMLPKDAIYYFTQARTHRAIPASDLLALFEAAQHQTSQITNHTSHITHHTSFPSVSAAISAAIAATTPDDIIFIGGSNYVVGEALSLL